MKNILVQLDPDPQPSLFDAVVALDGPVDHLLQYNQVKPTDVRDLVHGAVFTRGRKKLKHTAIFIGGSNVTDGERLLTSIQEAFLGPMRVSIMMDPSGANTTAAAAVLAAGSHLTLAGASSVVLAGTGPVGQRIARLLAKAGADVLVGSRKFERAEAAVQQITENLGDAIGAVQALETRTPNQLQAALAESQLVISAGAAGIRLLPETVMAGSSHLRVAVDLNAVEPRGVERIDVTDNANERDGIVCFGAIGVGSLKMKIHAAAVQRLFERNDQVLDAEEIFSIGQSVFTNQQSDST